MSNWLKHFFCRWGGTSFYKGVHVDVFERRITAKSRKLRLHTCNICGYVKVEILK